MSQKHKEAHNNYSSHIRNLKQQELEELAEARIITKNLVYIIGLSSQIANKNKLKKYEYLGQYGTIIKIVVNKNKAYNQNSPHGPSYSAYVTFSKPTEASIAILSLDDTMIDNHLIRASFGTTKYCAFFLKGKECNNKDCVFLHKIADESDIIKRGDLISNKVIFARQHSYAIKIADIFNPEVKRKILAKKKGKIIFPSPDLIYRSISVFDKNINKNYNNKKYLNNNSNYVEGENEGNEEEMEYEEEEDENYGNYKNAENVSNKSDGGMNNKESNISKEKHQILKRKKLFLNREKSRFDFSANNRNEEEIIDVPKIILNLINKKINLYNLTKYMHQILIDKIILNESIKDNKEDKYDEWMKFIKDNIEITNCNEHNNNDEFVNDIDNINHFILNKVSSQALILNK